MSEKEKMLVRFDFKSPICVVELKNLIEKSSENIEEKNADKAMIVLCNKCFP